jgi:anaerobic selenocysteine-containing dehydrogenase
VRITTRTVLAPFDPMATPGIDAVEAQGAPPRAGLAEPPGGDELLGADNGTHEANGSSTANGGAPARPKSLRWPVPVEVPSLPAPDAYSLRLVSPRRLYDHGVLLEACSSLAPLALPATVRANPFDLGRLGVTPTARVRVRSSRAALELEAVADDGVPRGVACIDFNLLGDDAGVEHPGASTLIDAAEPVTDVRIETLS